MNSRKLLVVAVALAALATACATASSTSTPDPTPTPEPVDLVTEDPNEDPEAFLAALPASEVQCAENAAGGRARLVELIRYDSVPAQPATAAEIDAVTACLSDSTAKGIFIGQLDRLAGGLSAETVACMTERVASVTLVAMLSRGETGDADAYLSLFQSIFCLNGSERAALESSSGQTFGLQRVGYIDSLECAFDYRDADGNLVVDQVFEFIAVQSEGGEFDPTSAEGSDQLRSLFTFVPAAVECGLLTNEDFEGSPLTATQMACLAEEGGDSILSLLALSSGDPTATPDLGQLAQLMSLLDSCGVSLDQFSGDGDLTGDLGAGSEDPSGDIEPTVEIPSLEELDLPLTDEQLACMQTYVSEEDIVLMIETGQPPANLFEALDACDISIEDLLAGS